METAEHGKFYVIFRFKVDQILKFSRAIRASMYAVFHVGSGEMAGARPLPHFRPKTTHCFARAFGARDLFSIYPFLAGLCAFYTIYSDILRFMTLFCAL